MQHWLVLLLPGGFSLPRQEVQHQVPGDADHPIAPHHVVSGHYQVIAMGQVSEEAKERSSKQEDLLTKNLILEAAFSRLEQQEIICWGLIISSLSSWIRPSSLMQRKIRLASSDFTLLASFILLLASSRPPVRNSTIRNPGVEDGRTKTPSGLRRNEQRCRIVPTSP